MPATGLKNLKKSPSSWNGRKTWVLRTLDGDEFLAFSKFAEKVQELSERTAKRYMEVVGRFLDYLIEAGAFGEEPLKTQQLNSIIDAYLPLLRDGSALIAARIRQRQNPSEHDIRLARTAEALGWSAIKPNSFSNTTAAINLFLRLSESIAQEEYQRAELLGIEHDWRPQGLIEAIRGTKTISSTEVHRMRQNSMLGSVAKYVGKGMQRPKRLSSPVKDPQADSENKDFPLAYLPQLVDAATSYRDRSLWLLLAAAGIRISEARNLLLEDVLFDEQRVYILDPIGRHFLPPDNVRNEPRFKGRAIAATYLFPPLRQQFFEALERYLKEEYVPIYRPGEAQYLFQYVAPSRLGQPLVNASDTALVKSFKDAVRRAGIPLPFDGEEYTPHSLRHLYGVYMLNDYPIDARNGRFGLRLTDVQMLMGHKKISTTQKYARVKSDRLMQKLQNSDEAQLYLSHDEKKQLPNAVLSNLALSV